MIHLYALSTAMPETRDLSGIEGCAVTALDCGALCAVVSEQEGAAEPTTEAILAHAAVIAGIAERVPTLPVRFGVMHRDAARLREAVAAREEKLLDTLRRVGDHVEFVVRADAPPWDSEPAETVHAVVAGDRSGAAPGRDYLERRLREERDFERWLDDVRSRLARLTAPLEARAAALTERQGQSGPERCFLVHRGAAQQFAEAASGCLAQDRDLLLGGPWPPYTFAGEAMPE